MRNLHYGLIGFSAYAYAIRFRGLLPTNVDWIFRDAIGDVAGFDSTANYLGWEFFRRGDFLVWPVGRSTLLGPEPGASIAMTDSLPLLGIPVKYLTWWTDQPLQYFGVWILLCFVLQALFAGRILQKFISSHVAVLTAVVLFPLMPFYLARIGVHTPISGHWTLLAAISLLFSTRLSWWPWLLIVVLAILTQPYLGAMVLVVFAARCAGSLFENRNEWRGVITSVATVLSAAGIVAFQAGLLVFGSGSLGTDNVGDFSANLLSLIDPEYDSPLMFNPNWSETGLIRNATDGVYQYEGFGYVGAGVVSLALIALLIWSARSRIRLLMLVITTVTIIAVSESSGIHGSSLIALAALVAVTCGGLAKLGTHRSQRLCLALTLVVSLLLAVTNRVTIGSQEFSYYWPGFLVEALGVIRVTGRFIWLVAYLVVIMCVVFVCRVVNSRKVLLSVLLVSSLFQLVDIRGAVSSQRALLVQNRTPTGLESRLWESVGERYKKIEVVLPGPSPVIQNPGPGGDSTKYNDDFWFAKRVLWADMSEFAAVRGISLNAFYFGREPMDSYAREGAKLRKVIMTNTYQDDTLYVFTDSALWNQAKTFRRDQDVVGLLDGIPIVAPNLRACPSCNFDDVVPVRPLGD